MGLHLKSEETTRKVNQQSQGYKQAAEKFGIPTTSGSGARILEVLLLRSATILLVISSFLIESSCFGAAQADSKSTLTSRRELIQPSVDKFRSPGGSTGGNLRSTNGKLDELWPVVAQSHDQLQSFNQRQDADLANRHSGVNRANFRFNGDLLYPMATSGILPVDLQIRDVLSRVQRDGWASLGIGEQLNGSYGDEPSDIKHERGNLFATPSRGLQSHGLQQATFMNDRLAQLIQKEKKQESSTKRTGRTGELSDLSVTSGDERNSKQREAPIGAVIQSNGEKVGQMLQVTGLLDRNTSFVGKEPETSGQRGETNDDAKGRGTKPLAKLINPLAQQQLVAFQLESHHRMAASNETSSSKVATSINKEPSPPLLAKKHKYKHELESLKQKQSDTKTEVMSAHAKFVAQKKSKQKLLADSPAPVDSKTSTGAVQSIAERPTRVVTVTQAPDEDIYFEGHQIMAPILGTTTTMAPIQSGMIPTSG